MSAGTWNFFRGALDAAQLHDGSDRRLMTLCERIGPAHRAEDLEDERCAIVRLLARELAHRGDHGVLPRSGCTPANVCIICVKALRDSVGS